MGWATFWAIFLATHLVTLVEVSHLSGMLVVDDLEHEGEERDEDLVAVLQVEAHVERLDVRKVLQQVEIPRVIVMNLVKINRPF
jgi:hypothetical protein